MGLISDVTISYAKSSARFIFKGGWFNCGGGLGGWQEAARIGCIDRVVECIVPKFLAQLLVCCGSVGRRMGRIVGVGGTDVSVQVMRISGGVVFLQVLSSVGCRLEDVIGLVCCRLWLSDFGN